MTTPSMEVGYVKADGTLTYDGMALLQRLSTLGGAKDFTITSPAAGQVMRYDGDKWVNSSGSVRVLLATRTASASATLDFTEFNNSVYRRYEFDLENVLPATDDVALFVRTSTNGGSSYDNGASDYYWTVVGMNGTVAANTGVAGATAISVTNNLAGGRVGNAAGEYGVNGIVRVFNAGNASSATDVQSQVNYYNTATAYSQYTGAGVRAAAADVDALRFLAGSGNITSGTIRMFGIV